MARQALETTEGRSSITALLGPTNTGKTHRAIERMLEHDTGMIGLPLRLLAREVYDRITRVVGESAVALITGEEKRVGQRARYWICTVEAMPLSREVEFLAIDEIQLAGHPQRGHVFTDRLLHARGKRETWFLGSDTMRPLIERLLPTARVVRHPRLSQLKHSGVHSWSSLPPRTAVVAFSMNRVYELAEKVRQRRGGAAVVLGALSPRARNAQVALYQSGEVDYMVATDAIGMGLNLDINHVAFADLRKFDGREARELEPSELAQIAGRAGRHMNDGSFGTLSPLPLLPDRFAKRIENHQFWPQRQLIWRNSELDFSSVDALVASLRHPPRLALFRPISDAADTSVLLELLRTRPDLVPAASSPERVALLWEICQIPDYRQLMLHQHVVLLAELFAQLTGPTGVLDPDWLAERIDRLSNAEADIDTLLARMAFVRTWTYITHHTHWLRDAAEWQARTLAIEDLLSDALHNQLVERFVDRGRGGKTKNSRRSTSKRSDASSDTPILAGPFQRLLELKLELEKNTGAHPNESDTIEDLIDAPHDHFRLDEQARLFAGDRQLGIVTRGADLLRPEVNVVVQDIGAGARSRLTRRLVAWLRDLVSTVLCPASSDPRVELSPAARGLCYQLERHLGTELTHNTRSQLDAISDADRARLQALGVRFGDHVVYVHAGTRAEAIRQRAAFVKAYYGSALGMPLSAAVSFRPQAGVAASAYLAVGYVVVGGRAIRADVVERVLSAATADETPDPGRVASWLGCSRGDAVSVLNALAKRPLPMGRSRSRRRRDRPRRRGPRPAAEERAD
jgi:ATP-dependent RNA helicase SUPV3L1/SUV3